MHKIIICSCLFIYSFSYCIGQSWLWGREAVPHSIHGGGDASRDHSTAVDGSGNVYTTGTYQDTITFGQDTFKGIGGVYLTKYNSNGNLIWAKNGMALSKNSYGWGFSVTTYKGEYVYVTGMFNDTIKFGTFTLINSGNTGGIFLVKYDSTGNVVWAKQSEKSSSFGSSNSIAVDDSGKIYITGFFADTISFGSSTLVTKPSHYGNVFLVKYDSTGNALWAKQGSVSSGVSWGQANSIAIDKHCNIYLTGLFQDTISFDSFLLKTASGAHPVWADIFIVKYNSSGNVIWAKQSEAAATLDNGADAYSISIDGKGYPYITGYFDDTISFGSDTLIMKNGRDFLVKYDSNGNVIWAKQCGDLISPVSCYPNSIASDTTTQGGGYLIFRISKSFFQNYKFKFGVDTFNLITNKTSASAIIHFDSSGKVLCGTIFSEGNEDDGDAVGVDKSGRYIYFGGDLADTTIFGSDTLVYGYDMPFVARWQDCSNNNASIPQLNNDLELIKVFPNPSSGTFTLSLSNTNEKCSIEIYNEMGKKVLTETLRSAQGDNLIELTNQPNGVYFYRVLKQDGGLVGSGKMVIQK